MTTLDKRSKSKRKVVVLKLAGKSGGQVFQVDKDRVVVGSVVSADVRLTGDGVSPIHAVIELSADQTQDVQVTRIFDLASDAGLFINGKKVVSSDLEDGDEITVGRHTLTFSLESQADVRGSLSKERIRKSDQGRDLYTNAEEDLAVLLLEDERKVREIFDYRPSHRQALEVVQSFGESILNIEHFVRESEVTIGPRRKSDFLIPAWLSTDKFPLVSRQGESFILNLDRAVMKGVLQRDGQLLQLADIPGTQVTLGRNEFAKVVLGDVSFYLSYTAAPPRLKRRKLLDSDPMFFKLYLTSLVLSALVLVGVYQVKVPDKLEAEPVPQRIATILYQPQKPIPTPVPRPKETTPPEPIQKPEPVKPKPPEPKPTVKPTPRKVDLDKAPKTPPKVVPKEMVAAKPEPVKPQAKPAVKPAPARSQGQNQAKEGAGARAKGAEGTRGEPNKAPSKTHQTAATRPSSEAGKGRGSGASQVPDIGNVDFLKSSGGKIENLLGNAGAQLGRGGSKLKGFGGFSTQGSGGQALSGDAKGGGGTADTLAGGLSNHGRGGGRVGTGLGAAGSGNGIVGGQTRVAIRSGGPEEVVVMGAIDSDAIEAALLAHKDEFRLCYEREINAEHPGAAGNVVPNFVIGGSGRVTRAAIESTSLRNPTVEGCVLRVIKRIEFPVPRGGGEVTVTKTFKFNPMR